VRNNAKRKNTEVTGEGLFQVSLNILQIPHGLAWGWT